MRQNPNEKIIRMWTAAAVLTVALIFLFIASRRMNSLSRIFFYQTGMGLSLIHISEPTRP